MKTLMHICCAPCANRPIAALREEGIGVTGFWFNPNIHPYTEYQARKHTLEEYAKEIAMKLVIGGDHRILDGVPLASFLNDMKKLLEDPHSLT